MTGIMWRKLNESNSIRHTFSTLLLLACLRVCGVAQNPVIQSSPARKDTVTRGIKPTYGSDRFYIAYLGLAYSVVKYSGVKEPFAASHSVGINYSLALNSLHPYYEVQLPQAIGNWDLALKVGFDGLRRMNFYGLGNETMQLTADNRFNWMRTRHQYVDLGINRRLGKVHTIGWSLLYDGIQVLDDRNRFVAKESRNVDPSAYQWQYFLGGRLGYDFNRVDNPSFPLRGVEFSTAASYTANLKQHDRSFTRYTADVDAYLPLPGSFSLALRGGVATLSGEPDFYQYNTIGGGRTVRGYRRWRYSGKTAAYNQNELRWLTSVDKGSLYGHFGFVAHFDQGRVWMPGAPSDKWHTGYGGGVILAPLDKIWVTAVYSLSKEDQRFHFGVSRNF